MISKKESRKIAVLKQAVLLPVMAAIGFLFTTKIVAQETIKTEQQQLIEKTQEGASQELLNEYQAIINKYKKPQSNGMRLMPVNQSDTQRLLEIFSQMSKKQQEQQSLVPFPRSSMILTRVVPTKEQIESFKDSKKYGIWIDGRRESNEILDNYKNTDFAQTSQSKLMKNAKNYGKHVYQVDLMTNDYYQNYYNETIVKTGSILVSNRSSIGEDK